MVRDPADALVMFGITGDLAKKKLIPALYELTAEDRLEMTVVGAARSDWTDEELRDHVREVLAGSALLSMKATSRLNRSM